MQEPYMITSFLVFCYVFIVFYGMITFKEAAKKYRQLTGNVILTVVALIALYVLIGIANFHEWIVTPDGRYVFVGLATFLFGPLIGLIVAIGNIFFSYLYEHDNLILITGVTLVNYAIFYSLAFIVDRVSYIKRVLLSLVVIVLSASLTYGWVRLINADMSSLAVFSMQWVLHSTIMKFILINAVGLTTVRERDRTRTIDELKSAREALINKNKNVRQLNDELLQSEQLLAKANAELETKVALRTKELESSNKGLEAEVAERKKIEIVLKKAQSEAVHANKAKSEFLANMSHEIRTPINAIMGFNYLLGNTRLSHQQRNYLKKANDSSEHLLNLINDILDFSKIEADQMTLHYSKVSIYKILNSVFDNVMYQAYKKNLTILFNMSNDMPEYGYLDGKKFYQILLNLMSNAVKFTDKGNISVTIKNASIQDERCLLQISIADTGIGIPEKYQESLFDAFSQVEGTITRRYGGTGLGLSISKSLVELMGGEISVDSKLGVGSTFTFGIWIDRVIYEPNYMIPEPMKVALVHRVDDREKLIDKQLIKLGCEVRVFSFDEFEPSPVFKRNFDKIFIECGSPDTFDLNMLTQVVDLLDCPEKIFFVSHYRIDYLQQLTQKGLVKDLILNPIGTEDLYHILADTVDNETIATGVSYETRYKNLRVLLVEDNPLNQLVCLEILKDRGIEVAVAADGQEALDCIGDDNFDLILMDIHMPVMDGLEATKRIRMMDGMSNLPILAMTADAMSDNEEAIFEAGLTDIILKPIDVKKMFEKIETYL